MNKYRLTFFTILCFINSIAYFVLQSFNSQTQYNMSYTKFTKGDTVAILATARKIQMTTETRLLLY
jgi:hypothetical protein